MYNRILQKLRPKDPKEIAKKELKKIKLRKTDIAIDCGANVGKVTKQFARSKATVYAFEPNPHAFKILQEKFKDKPNVHCIQKGVMDRNGMMKLYLHTLSDQDPVYWSTWSSLLEFKRNMREDRYVEIEVVDLCEFIESLQARVKVLKMDVEGVESKILKKLIDTGIIHTIDHIFVETHDYGIPEIKSETDEVRALIGEKQIQNINLDWI